jgi:hypothetical protein
LRTTLVLACATGEWRDQVSPNSDLPANPLDRALDLQVVRTICRPTQLPKPRENTTYKSAAIRQIDPVYFSHRRKAGQSRTGYDNHNLTWTVAEQETHIGRRR